jgi:hypothetical protein
MDTKNITKERYMPRLRGSGWIEQENWSIYLPDDEGIPTKHYGLPEDYKKYFIVRESVGFKKPNF